LARAAISGWQPALAASAVWLLAQPDGRLLLGIHARWDQFVDPKIIAVYAGAISTAAE
jgi:hypothetical protein